MGSGKSHWGRRWALKHDYTFYDLDEEIEKTYQMPVEKIFQKHGEGKFREMERDHLHQFREKQKCLISCGGGTPCYFDNLAWMKENGVVIYLQASPTDILQRVEGETSKRPLLKEVNSSELLFFIETKLKEREPVYLQANFILNTPSLTENSLEFLFKNQVLSIPSPVNENEKGNGTNETFKNITVHHA